MLWVRTDAVLGPTSVVDEVSKHELCMLMGRRFGRNSDQDDEEGNEGCPKGDMPEERQGSPVAVEKECKDVDDLVSDKDMP